MVLRVRAFSAWLGLTWPLHSAPPAQSTSTLLSRSPAPEVDVDCRRCKCEAVGVVNFTMKFGIPFATTTLEPEHQHESQWTSPSPPTHPINLVLATKLRSGRLTCFEHRHPTSLISCEEHENAIFNGFEGFAPDLNVGTIGIACQLCSTKLRFSGEFSDMPSEQLIHPGPARLDAPGPACRLKAAHAAMLGC